MVKNLPATQETWVSSLSWEDTLEKETASHSSIFAWRIPWTEKPGGLQFTGRDQCVISDVISVWSSIFSVRAQSRDKCMISHLSSA